MTLYVNSCSGQLDFLQHVWLYKLYASGKVYPFGTNRGIFPIISWGKAYDQIELLFRSLLFWLLGC
jgi:hypothetical protein